MIKLSKIFYNDNIVKTVYHGSEIEISEDMIKSGTYFSNRLNIAKQYGKYIYRLKLDSETEKYFKPDVLKEHLISNCSLPKYLFDVKKYK